MDILADMRMAIDLADSPGTFRDRPLFWGSIWRFWLPGRFGAVVDFDGDGFPTSLNKGIWKGGLVY